MQKLDGRAAIFRHFPMGRNIFEVTLYADMTTEDES